MYKNLEKKRNWQIEYAKKNKERINANSRKSYEKHQEERLNHAFEYRLKNKNKIKEYHKNNYAKNKNKIKLRNKNYKLKKKNEFKKTFLLNKVCINCGASNHLLFHHSNPKSKIENINRLIIGNWVKLIEELKKCIILCRHCHMKIHGKEMAMKRVQKRLEKCD